MRPRLSLQPMQKRSSRRPIVCGTYFSSPYIILLYVMCAQRAGLFRLSTSYYFPQLHILQNIYANPRGNPGRSLDRIIEEARTEVKLAQIAVSAQGGGVPCGGSCVRPGLGVPGGGGEWRGGGGPGVSCGSPGVQLGSAVACGGIAVTVGVEVVVSVGVAVDVRVGVRVDVD